MTVYFIQSGEGGPVKIGHTNGDVKRRLEALQTGNPAPLKLLLSIDGGRDIERIFHKRLRVLGFLTSGFGRRKG